MSETGAIVGVFRTDFGVVKAFLSGEFVVGEFDRGVGLRELGGEGGEFARARAFV